MWSQHRCRIIVTCHFHSKNREYAYKTKNAAWWWLTNEHVRLQECEEGRNIIWRSNSDLNFRLDAMWNYIATKRGTRGLITFCDIVYTHSRLVRNVMLIANSRLISVTHCRVLWVSRGIYHRLIHISSGFRIQLSALATWLEQTSNFMVYIARNVLKMPCVV